MTALFSAFSVCATGVQPRMTKPETRGDLKLKGPGDYCLPSGAGKVKAKRSLAKLLKEVITDAEFRTH